MIDRDQLREAIAILDDSVWPPEAPYNATVLVRKAARLVADPDTLVISKVDGEWPEWLTEAIDPDAYIAALGGQPK